MSMLSVTEYLRVQGAQVNEYIQTLFAEADKPAKLFQAMNYSLLSNGKRLRPVLCLASASAFGISEEHVLPAAAALELVHCYSLIHDDLPSMDNDDLRRGRPTNHKVFGDATALLAGDALLTHAFDLLSQPLNMPAERQLLAIRSLAQAAGPYGMVGGQQADIEAEKTGGELDALKFIHTRKTAALIQASVVIGGLFAELSNAQREALSQYGLRIGLAFQMIDDLLDVVGTEEQIGKKTGMDEQLNKLTYPRLVGPDETRQLAVKEVKAAQHALQEAGIDAPLLDALASFVVDRDK